MAKLRSRISQELKIHEEMKALIISIVTANTKDENWKPFTTVGLKLQKGLVAQERVGWFQILHGRLANDFIICLAEVDNTSAARASAEMHGKRLLRFIWDSFLQLWKQRNEAVHGITEHSRKMAQIQAMEMKIRHCYEQQFIMPIDDQRRIFQIPEEERLKQDQEC
jgi:hypothetical protein